MGMGQDAPTSDLALPDDVELLKAMIRELLDELHKKTVSLESVQHRLDQLLRRLYGPKSERFRPDQPSLFDDPLDPAPPSTSTSDPADASAPVKRRGPPHGRRKLPADLLRERVIHDLTEPEKDCPCCQGRRIQIGEEVSEQLDYRPAKLLVLQHVRLKYACPKCLARVGVADEPVAATSSEPVAEATAEVNAARPEPLVAMSAEANGEAATEPIGMPVLTPVPACVVDPSSLIVTAAKPPQPIDKGLAAAGLLAHVITGKYVDHLPLHRQESILARLGVELSRSTLCDWMAACANLFVPLYHVMLREVLQSQAVHCDETRVPVQEPGRDQVKSGRLWVYVGDRDHRLIVYDYTPTKARDGPAAILANYTGFIQADAANVFDGIYLPGAITEVGCWAHARRYYHEAKTTDAARSAEAIARIRGFYAVEDEAKDLIQKQKLSGIDADAVRRRLRQEKTVPQLKGFAEWIEAEKTKVLPKSPIGQAIAYAQRHWQALLRFAEYGFLDIDNNEAERAFRAVAIGRKNWLFAGSDAGGKTAAVLYTITQTCKRHQIDPFEYLRDVLTRIPSHPADRLAELVPHRWAQSQRDKLNSPA
jgi:transposase